MAKNTISVMREQHSEPVYELISESFPQRMHPYIAYCQPGTPTHLRQFFKDPGSDARRTMLVALDDDRVIGFADMTHRPSANFLSYIAVHAGHRGTGLAKAMLSRCVENGGGGPVQLDVFSDNDGAKQFYDRLHFRHEYDLYWRTRTLTPVPADELGATDESQIRDFDAAMLQLGEWGFTRLTVQREGSDVAVGMPSRAVARLDEQSPGACILVDSLSARIASLRQHLSVSEESSASPGWVDLAQSHRLRSEANW